MKTNPDILLDLIEDLQFSDLIATDSNTGEGRMDSLLDEKTIVTWIQNHHKWSKYANSSKARNFADLTIVDDNKIYPINIKTMRDFNGNGAGSNATSKKGFLWALTDLEQIPKAMNYNTFMRLFLDNMKDTERDYYYLVFSKEDMNINFLRGAKQIVNWRPNPSNDLQINFTKEYQTENRNYSYEESCKNIIGGLKLAALKRQENEQLLINSPF